MILNDGTYDEYLRRFIGEDIIVVDDGGHRFTGVCVAVNFQHLNIVLTEVNGNLVVVRNVRYVKLINKVGVNKNG